MMHELGDLIAGLFQIIALLVGVILVFVAIALIIGFWPLALLMAAGGLFSLAKIGSES